jgi:hypothetical protein
VRHGAIAQLGERLLCKQEVTGSNPVGSIAQRAGRRNGRSAPRTSSGRFAGQLQRRATVRSRCALLVMKGLGVRVSRRAWDRRSSDGLPHTLSSAPMTRAYWPLMRTRPAFQFQGSKDLAARRATKAARQCQELLKGHQRWPCRIRPHRRHGHTRPGCRLHWWRGRCSDRLAAVPV